ncbi:hypothetical protein GCM10010172_57800 [Paractinoplanes ferrugineus]|uniref:Uncharacterized protein n=1 Tax=Paractinoplanes ferrugineus TaxID=113564 RepID=A0A919MDL3_9ACTN|nr:hypothetical protein [Actinoplanes ferrugineus]GIE15916.1 hypothetical protein Afe05nite_77560 [Actinoplanes ferrugineus]
MVQRVRGSLAGLDDEESRSLRPIGMSVRQAATLTGALLDRLAGTPGVVLFAGVRVTKRTPRIGFAVSTATHLLLVESVAWPSGAYSLTPQGQVLCDGTYIGQSVQTLLGSVRQLRRVARRRHVGAVVVVHPSGSGTPALPAGPAWLPPAEAGARIANRLRLRRRENTFCPNDINSWYAHPHRPSLSPEGPPWCVSGSPST